MTYVWAELEAYGILLRAGQTSMVTSSINGHDDIREAADKIILLAEKIKAQRLTASMK